MKSFKQTIFSTFKPINFTLRQIEFMKKTIVLLALLANTFLLVAQSQNKVGIEMRSISNTQWMFKYDLTLNPSLSLSYFNHKFSVGPIIHLRTETDFERSFGFNSIYNFSFKTSSRLKPILCATIAFEHFKEKWFKEFAYRGNNKTFEYLGTYNFLKLAIGSGVLFEANKNFSFSSCLFLGPEFFSNKTLFIDSITGNTSETSTGHLLSRNRTTSLFSIALIYNLTTWN